VRLYIIGPATVLPLNPEELKADKETQFAAETRFEALETVKHNPRGSLEKYTNTVLLGNPENCCTPQVSYEKE